MVTVPNVVPERRPSRRTLSSCISRTGSRSPRPSGPDVAVPIDDVIDKKIDALDAHVSQVYEWLPWSTAS